MNAEEKNLEIWQTNNIERVYNYLRFIQIFASEMECTNEKFYKGCLDQNMVLKERLSGDGIAWRCMKCKTYVFVIFSIFILTRKSFTYFHFSIYI